MIKNLLKLQPILLLIACLYMVAVPVTLAQTVIVQAILFTTLLTLLLHTYIQPFNDPKLLERIVLFRYVVVTFLIAYLSGVFLLVIAKYIGAS